MIDHRQRIYPPQHPRPDRNVPADQSRALDRRIALAAQHQTYQRDGQAGRPQRLRPPC